MKPELLYWSLMHSTDQQRQVTGLTYDQTRFVVDLIAPGELQNWLAWHEGLPKWMPLSEFKPLTGPQTSPRMSTPPFPPNTEIGGMEDAETGLGIEALPETEPVEKYETRPQAVEAPQVDKRLTRRFLKEFAVQIIAGDGKAFNTVTVNISSSGMMLRDRLPDGLGKTFNCVISREDGVPLKVFCSLVRESGVKSAGSRVKFMDVAQPKVLLNWLIDSKTR